MKLQELPDGIIITISQQMLKEKGLLNWYRDFYKAMNTEGWTYWMRQGARPKYDILHIYINIGNKIRYRCNFVMTQGPGEMTFHNGKTMFAKVWIVACGPMVKAPHEFPMRGFRGFRYTKFLF